MGEESVYTFINSTVNKSKYCSDVTKKHFNKEHVMTTKIKNSTKCYVYDDSYVHGDVKVRYNCHNTGKYRGSAHSHYHIKVKLNHKISVIFHNLKNYDSHVIMQEIGKFSFKINIITIGLEKHVSFNIDSKLAFILITSNF